MKFRWIPFIRGSSVEVQSLYNLTSMCLPVLYTYFASWLLSVHVICRTISFSVCLSVYGVVSPILPLLSGWQCKLGYLSCITPNFFSAISGHAKKKIAHQANPQSVAENPFANLFSDLLISDLVLLRLFGGPERQTSHFVGGYRVLYPFSEWRPFIRPQKHFTRACIETGYYFKKNNIKDGAKQEPRSYRPGCTELFWMGCLGNLVYI